MLNHIVIMGRFTKDPEMRRTQQSGLPVTSFSLAVERDFKAENGTREVDFIDCVAWRGTAEFACKYFGKGQMAAVEGRLQIRNWNDKDGNKRRSAEVLVSNIYFCGSRQQGGQSGNYQAAPSATKNAGMSNEYAYTGEEELPF